MKALGIGLIILLVGLILSTYVAYVSYSIYHDEVTLDTVKTASVIGLVANIIALIGVAIFIVEFRASLKPGSKS